MLMRLPIFFFNDTATTEIYTLSLHDALPISWNQSAPSRIRGQATAVGSMRANAEPARSYTTRMRRRSAPGSTKRSEEHTSELQSQSNLVCRLLLEKKKKPRPARAPAARLRGH